MTTTEPNPTTQALESIQSATGTLMLRNESTDPETGLNCILIPKDSANMHIAALRLAHDHLQNRIEQLEETLLQALIMIDESNGETEEDSRNADLWAAFHGDDEQ